MGFNDLFFVKKPPVDREPNDPYRAPKHISASFTMPTKVRGRKDVQPTLYDVKLEWGAVLNNLCPVCVRKLYWNRARTIIRCKSKLHSFVLPKKTYDDIVSGKRLQEYKLFTKEMGR